MRDTTKKDDTRQRLIEAGAGIMHRKGYNGTGIQEVLDACGVPKGSFYHFFKSKEDFALQVVDHQAALMAGRVRLLLNDAALSPLARVRRFFERTMERLTDPTTPLGACGCPIGNLVQEMAPANPAFRQRLDAALRQLEQDLAGTLRQAQAAQEIAPGLDPDGTAQFMVASWQGAILRMKAAGDPAPLVRAKDLLLGLLAS